METNSFGDDDFRDPDVDKRARAFLRRVFLALMALALAASLAGTLVTNQHVTQERERAAAKTAEASLIEAALLAVSPVDSLPNLAAAAQLDVMIVGPDGVITTVPLAADSLDGEWALWRTRVRQNAARDARSFDTVDPTSTRWLHHRVAMPDGSALITGRPQLPDTAAMSATAPWLLIGSLLLVGLGAAWWILQRRIARPASLLLSATEDLRVRGEIRPNVQASIDRTADTPSEFARIGALLRDIEAQSQRDLAQNEELLRAANILGRSLDPQTVLAAALQPLQRLLGNDRSAILQYNARTDRFEVVTARGHSAEWLTEISMAPAGEAQASMRSIREGIPIQITDTESEIVSESAQHRARRHGYRSVLAVPLTGELERQTTLVLQAAEPRAYSFDEIELSKSFGSIASAALRNAELFSQTDAKLRVQTEQLEAIVESVEQGLLVAGSDGRVLFANATMRQLAASTFSDRSSADVYLSNVLASTDMSSAARAQLNALAPGDRWVDIDVGPAGAAEQRAFRVRKFVVRDAGGQLIGHGQTWTDVSSELELANMKSGLLATVSHEFRTPLALIKGYATTLLAEDVEWNVADQREFLNLVSGEADRLTELVQRILDMRRIDAGMVQLQMMPMQIASVVEAACAGLPHAADRIVIADLPTSTIDVDAARISTALRNLVDNACKYSPNDQPVVISADASAHELVLRVRDFGRGVDDAARTRIFETFVRGQSGLAAEHSGVGLGLAISKGFVEAHQGRIWTEQPSDGRGALFCVALPLQQDPVDDLVSTP